MTFEAPPAPGAGACPAPEQLAAYVEGGLSEAERMMVEAHLVDCADCRDIVGSAASMPPMTAAAVPAPVVPMRRSRGKWIAISGGLLAAAAALLIVVRLQRTDPMTELVRAADGGKRSIEARLSADFAYAPLAETTRSGNAAVSSPELRIAAARLEQRVGTDRSPENLHALGAAQLLLGDYDAAITTLDEALRTSSNAQIASDLAAAYLARARRENRPDDYTRALDAAERASRSRATPAALFNRALALEALKLRDPAKAAWQAYLAADSTSPWADEARRHLAELTSQVATWEQHRAEFFAALRRNDLERAAAIILLHPSAAREALEDELLPDWARSCASSCDARRFATAEFVAKQLAALGDGMDLETLSRLSDRPPAGVLASLEAYGRARLAYKSSNYQAATPGFQSALSAMTAASLPLSFHAAFHVAVAKYRDGSLESADEHLRATATAAESRAYFTVAGKCRWVLGLIALAHGRLTAAVEEYRHALSAFERARDAQGAANAHALIAEALDFLGQPDAAWGERVLAFAAFDPMVDPRRWNATLISAAHAAEEQNAPFAALALQDEVIRFSERSGRPSDGAEARLYRARILDGLGSREAATRELSAARDVFDRLPDHGLSARLHAEADLAEGRLLSRSASREATGSLARAAAFFENAGSSHRTADIELQLARAEETAGRQDEAAGHLLKGIAAFEESRTTVGSDALRVSYFDEHWQLYDDMVRLQLKAGHNDQAFSYAERGRARSLLDNWQRVPGLSSLTPIATREQLPPTATLIYFVDQGAAIVCWVLTQSRTDFLRLSLPPGFDATLEQFSSPAAADAVAARVYEALWEPLRSHLPPNGTIVIVPSRRLQSLPFARLRSPQDHLYLIEHYAFVVSPSAAVFVAMLPRLRSDIPPADVLVAGGVPERAGPSWPALVATSAEIASIGRLYPHMLQLTDATETRSAFMAALPSHGVVHFAGHAIVNKRYPNLSRLVMAGIEDGVAEPDVFATDVAALRLSATRLVVLSACSTAAGAQSYGEGVLSLARAFLAAGVPNVIASLWDVEDDETAALMTRFHREYATSGDAVAALRQAQLSMLHDSDARFASPTSWAPFQVFGGITSN